MVHAFRSNRTDVLSDPDALPGGGSSVLTVVLTAIATTRKAGFAVADYLPGDRVGWVNAWS